MNRVQGRAGLPLTEEWHSIRKHTLSASRVANCAGVGYQTASKFYKIFNGLEEETISEYQQHCMDVGRRDEPLILRLLSYWLPPYITMRECRMFRNRVRGIDLLATPDALAYDTGLDDWFVVEVKRPINAMYDAPKLHHLIQIFVQMLCTNLNRAIYAAYHPDWGLHVWGVNFTARARRAMLTEVLGDCRQFLRATKPPRMANLKYKKRHLELSFRDSYTRLVSTPPLAS